MELSDFALDLRACLAPAHHIGVTSGGCVVQPWLPTVCGVSNVFSPPFAARGLRLGIGFQANGHPIRDDGNTGKGDCGLLYAGGTWFPDRIERRGTYHHLVNDRLISLSVSSRLVPLFDRAGFALQVSVRNRASDDVTIKLLPNVDPGTPALHPLETWEYPIPKEGPPATQSGPWSWSNGNVDIHLVHQSRVRTLKPGEEGRWELAIIVQASGDFLGELNIAAMVDATKRAWVRRLQASAGLPLLQSNDPSLDAYYRRSLASGLVCLWERSDFVCNPFVAVCGMDGGGICCYPWDVAGYPPRAMACLLGKSAKDLLGVMSTFGIDKHMLFSVTGKGLHHYYAYSTWAYISFVWAMACQYGPDQTVYDQACEAFLNVERNLQTRNHLADYGIQKNLLEMRGAGWEHFVASPNAERAWCFERLADLGQQLGRGDNAEWHARAAEIRRSIQSELWDEKAGWFRAMFPNGHAEMVYSIQGFDALRHGACTDEMARAMISHVRDGAFLGQYGVSSVSAEDERHYELNDPDWSGGGAYSGDGPQLAMTLWERGESNLAWDVLRRHLWMGQHLPYFPQEHYCDRPAVAPHKRANVVSGVNGAEAILFGLIGLSPQIDGKLAIKPQPPSGLNLKIAGFPFRGRSVDIELNDGQGQVKVDGASTRIRAGEPVSISLVR